MTLTDDQIPGVGFSRPKVAFIKDLAAHVLDGRLDLKDLKRYPDDEVRELVAVKGIGRWTAEIFLMFRLRGQTLFDRGGQPDLRANLQLACRDRCAGILRPHAHGHRRHLADTANR